MKEITTTSYRCDYCHVEYTNKEQCIQCEKKHIKPKAIAGQTFAANAQFPKTIDIEFEDGRVFEYKLAERMDYYN